MRSADLLVDAFGRIQGIVHRAVDNLSAEQLAFRPDSDSNSVAWLVWHLTRIQDDHIADAAGTGQIWSATDWAKRFDLPFDLSATGYAHTAEDVAAVQVSSGELLTGYHDAVHDQSVRYVKSLDGADFDRIVDTAWDPPVSLGVRLISVLSDNLQHAGQAAFVRGILERV
jgi:uncharacterized damage-inducible protein DinB